MSHRTEQQIAEILAHAESGRMDAPPHGESEDVLVQGVRRLAVGARASAQHAKYVDKWLARVTEAVRIYPSGDLANDLAAEGIHAQLDALGESMTHLVSALDEGARELAEARDAALAANVAKDVFLANMSHELRTPLNAIIGYAELVAEEATEIGAVSIATDTKRVLRSGRQLLALITDVLDMSKIEAGRMHRNLEDFDVGNLCVELGESLRPLADERSNHLVVHVPTNVAMTSDSGKIRQILTNLVSNALKFTYSGEVVLSAEALPERVTLTVADNGVGIPADRLAAVFEPFVQADTSVHRRAAGTGLGLSITRRLARLLGGEVDVESVVGQGSRFTVTLPRRLEVEDPTLPTTPEPATVRSTSAPRILVVDDDPAVHELVRRHFQDHPVVVASARNGREALVRARANPPAVIVLDVLMPEMDGWTTLGRLKSDPALARIPVVMMSMVDNRTRGIALGADDYLLKPVDRRRMIEVVGRYAGLGRRVMVVDDDPDVRELVRRALESHRLDVVVAEHGRDALAQLAERPVDLIVLDLRMPEMDGFELVRRLESEPRLRRIPRVVLTGVDLSPEEQAGLQSGVEVILTKQHARPDQLMDKVAGVLQQRLGTRRSTAR